MHGLQQLELDLRGYYMCYNSHPSQRGVAYETNVLYMSGSSSMALETVMLIDHDDIKHTNWLVIHFTAIEFCS